MYRDDGQSNAHETLGVTPSFLCLIAVLATQPAAGEGADGADRFDELAARQTAFSAVVTVERIAARMIHVESVALLSELGVWPPELENWPEDAKTTKYVYDIKNLEQRLRADIVALRRHANPGGAFSAVEAVRFLQLVEELDQMLTESQDFFKLFSDGRVYEANQFFREKVRQRYARIEWETSTLGSAIRKDIESLKRKATLKSSP
ncbi:hypothetical protein OU426_08060 [Frigidibacter sp. RF13]|uniref:hypothetical protein n=1 Tax=Frigidibacter sp. RF13 TaxID=2997340 RepID=UPI002271B2DF|nr:hypothetical protein [Frigidibacter sp. RF13]MCY1126803.1 hypothetical protein [Frigidibacter sp. RF13]